jgi:hypothetical protein
LPELQAALAFGQIAQASLLEAPDRDLPPVPKPPAPHRRPSTNKLADYRTSNNQRRSNIMRRQLKQFFTGLVLVLLAAGFTSLGFLSFAKRQPGSAIHDFFSEANYSMIGGSLSILVGGTFLAAAILFAGMMLRRKSFPTLEHRNGQGTPID